MLDNLSLEQVMMFWNYGQEAQLEQAEVLVGILGMSMNGKKLPSLPKIVTPDDQKPDRKAFYKHYGDRIKRG